MAATTRLPPPVQLRTRLEVARAKGTPFRIAFNFALRNIDYPSDWDGGQEWRHILKDTREEWEAAYLGRPALVPSMAVVVEALTVAA